MKDRFSAMFLSQDQTMPDKRLNAWRPDLADERLRGIVSAERYVAGTPAQIAIPVAALRPRPEKNSGIDTELLLGETVRVFDRADGWAWVQADADHYTGYMPEEWLTDIRPSGHRVIAPRTFIYPEAELRRPPVAAISMGSRLHVTGEAETRGTRYLLLENGHAVIAGHCIAADAVIEADYVDIALRFLETPYLWGGRSGFGIDCSGLVQLALCMKGQVALRDTDLQARSLGMPVDRDELQRGDLVFWKGHVGIMVDEDNMLHANGHTMSVACENFSNAVERIASLYQYPTGYRRP